MQGVLAADGAIAVRVMRDEDADYRLLAGWLTDPAVLGWYEGRDQPHDYDRVRAKYSPRVLAEEQVRPCIIELTGCPVGYLQYYPVVEPTDYGLDSAEDTWAFDLFLGDPALWGTGVGSRALRLMVDYVAATHGARRMVIDPRIDNLRAIRAYEKVGFAKVKVLAAHEHHEGAMRDCWLMAMVAPRPGQAGT